MPFSYWLYYPVTIYWVVDSGAPAAQRAAKRSPILIMRKRRKPMSWFSHGYHGERYCSWARTHDDDSGGDGVAQHGGHTPKEVDTERQSLGLICTSLILDISATINWHLSKQGIRWPVPRGHIAGSSLQLIEVTCFFEVDRWPIAIFPIGSRAHVRLTYSKQGRVVLKNPIITFSSIKMI